MSKSLGNFVGLRDEPNLMYGRVMSLNDEAMPDWFRLASGLGPAEARAPLASLEAGELAPVEAKRLLARTVVARFHDAAAAEAAEDEFLRVHRHRELPTEIPEARLPPGDPVYLPGLLVAALGISSNSEARRLIEGGGVRLEGEPVSALELPPGELAGRVMQVGRRRFVRLVA
jgi:tyrosyl-tRNA synthetase